MAEKTGRFLKVKRNGTLIAAVVSKTISINNEAVDITTDDDLGFRKLLEESGTRSVDISVEGVLKNDVLLEDAGGASLLIKTAEIEFQSGLKITGDFRLNNIEVSGETADKIQFSAELQSTGAFTVTPAP